MSVIRSTIPQVMRGYWNKPEETAKVTTADGYLSINGMSASSTIKLSRHGCEVPQGGHRLKEAREPR